MNTDLEADENISTTNTIGNLWSIFIDENSLLQPKAKKTKSSEEQKKPHEEENWKAGLRRIQSSSLKIKYKPKIYGQGTTK